jgi:hypothetical protein
MQIRDEGLLSKTPHLLYILMSRSPVLMREHEPAVTG